MFARPSKPNGPSNIPISLKDLFVPSGQNIFYNCPTECEASAPVLYHHVEYPELLSQKYLIYEAPNYYFDGTPAQYNPLPYPPSEDVKSKLNFPHLTFDSNFESGNLLRAVLISPLEYNLLLRPDGDTQSGNQWFYFEFDLPESNIKKNIKFNILNNIKPTSLFSHGMQPLLYCYRCSSSGQALWRRCGFNISYTKNNYTRYNPQSNAFIDNYYTLTFTFSCHHSGKHRIAYSYPYTYSDLLLLLRYIKQHPTKSTNCKITSLCKTIGNRMCPLLTISDFSMGNDVLKHRPTIILTGRVHPGETPGSWIMVGLIDELLGPSSIAQELRKTYVFKIVPMLNPDGVAIGNSRCSLAGVDLNRYWNHPNPTNYPTIYNTKEMLRKLSQEQHVSLFCDIHGHSRYKDIFLFGCDSGSTTIQSFVKHLMDNNLHDYINYTSCSFHIQKSREGTGRVVVHKEFNVTLSFTMEASCCGGGADTKYDNIHYNIRNYKEIGCLFIRSMLFLKNVIPSSRSTIAPLPKIEVKSKHTSRDSHRKKTIEVRPDSRNNSISSTNLIRTNVKIHPNSKPPLPVTRNSNNQQKRKITKNLVPLYPINTKSHEAKDYPNILYPSLLSPS